MIDNLFKNFLKRSKAIFQKKPLLARVFFVILASIILLPSFSFAKISEQQREDLKKKLQEIQNKIEVYNGQIRQKQNDAVSLQREVGILDAQAEQAQLEIQQTELAINQLNMEIDDRVQEMSGYQEKIDSKKEILAECLRAIYEYDQTSLSEIILTKDSFSDFFNAMQSIESLQTEVQGIVNDLNSLKKGIEDQKSALEDQRNDQSALAMLQQAQRRFIEQQEQKKNDLLQQTKGQEAIFKKLMDKANSDVASIKNQLYKLDDVGVSMTFQEALNHAEFAASKTGVRPAFLLAILKKETSWGTNVGTGSWRSDMKERDQDDFVAICRELGFDPDLMPVSRKPSYGWGGAMGAAQFLPSTWRSYQQQIAQLTGHNPPNPWSLDDAFTAAAIKLGNNGANQKTYNAEWKAAMLYFAGSRWNNPVYSFYGNSVMGFAAALQVDIDAINGR